MFGVTFLDEIAECEAVEKDARLRRREIPPVICALTAPDGAEKPADRPAIIPGRSCSAQPPRAASAYHLLPCHPIDEKDDMTGFLIY
jgi:hypothetical protein